MTILFLGQRGVRLSPASNPSAREARILALSQQLAAQGHQVTVLCTPPYCPEHMTKIGGVVLRRLASLNPQKPGGWLYLALSLRVLWRLQPSVAHVHGWRAASLLWLAALLSPETTYIWTVDTLPQKIRQFTARVICWQALQVCDAVTAPTRTLQYQLLHYLNLRTTYVPDGYERPVLKALPAKTWQLRKGQYAVVLGETTAALKQIKRAHKATGSRKTLLPLPENCGPRARYSFLSHAAAVVLADASTPQHLVLEAMDSGRPIIAVNAPEYQEVLGVTGQFYAPKDTKTLKLLLSTALKTPRAARAAAVRARAHFTWMRIIPEYVALYRASALRPVPVDSVQPVLAEQQA